MEKGMQTKFYPGTTKAAAQEGYEKLDSNADNAIFAYCKQNPRAQGWRDAPQEESMVIGFCD